MSRRQSLHGQWSSRLAFILAAMGAAVGLGSIWRFPYMAGTNGGGAFVLIYLGCVFAIGLPVFMAEAMLGRRGRRNPIKSMRLLSEEEAGHSSWQVIGWLGVFAGMLILSYYSVIAGWTFNFTVDTLRGTFTGAEPAAVIAYFAELTANPWKLVFWHTVFMALTVYVVGRGVEQGLEKGVKVVMPVLFLVLLALVLYSMTTARFMDGVHYLFQADFSRVTPHTVLDAMGQAFFSLSIGMGAIMAYGAYLPDDSSIPETSFTVVLAVTVVALLAGLVVFPSLLLHGLDPASIGPGLTFVSLSVMFGDMPGGMVFGTVFFLLLVFAAWSSSIGLIEPAVARLVEKYGMPRPRAALLIGLAVWALGLLTVSSFNVLSGVHFLAGSVFHNLDYLAANILLPLGGLLIAVFAGWIMCRSSAVEELEMGTGFRYALWLFLTRWFTPVAMILIFLNATDALELFWSRDA